MKSISLLAATAFLALGVSARADSVTLTGIHNCCKGCDNGIIKAITSIPGAAAATTKTTVTVTAGSKAEVDKAVQALLEAGYYGEGAPVVALPDKKVKTATVSGTHLCCGKCVKGIDEVVKHVKGATGHDATKGADSFTVSGDFSLKDLQVELNKAGYNGKIE